MPDTHDEDSASDVTAEADSTAQDTVNVAESSLTDDSATDDHDDASDGAADEDSTDASGDEATDDTSDDEDATPSRKRRRRFFFGRKKDDVTIPDYAIRICTLDDLDKFDPDSYIHPEIVRSWLALQQFGEATVLVMWYKDDTPAGQALISWTGDWNDEIRHKLKGVPAICNLHVDDAHRGHHIGRKLVDAAEKLVKGSGYPKITLSIPDDNDEALALYDKLGYEDSGLHSTTTYTYRDAEGKKKKTTDRTIALVKEF